jgi:alpha-D-ribose 1-methylphosphonate 5-triphosphate synthase subunit PhnG
VGEATVTRCAVELEGGAVGVAYVRGRDQRHAELAAVLDALLQDPSRRDDLERTVVAPLAAAQAERRRAAAERVAPSRVEFFTMVRGDD